MVEKSPQYEAYNGEGLLTCPHMMNLPRKGTNVPCPAWSLDDQAGQADELNCLIYPSAALCRTLKVMNYFEWALEPC